MNSISLLVEHNFTQNLMTYYIVNKNCLLKYIDDEQLCDEYITICTETYFYIET